MRSPPTATRATALDELGLEPSPELRALERRVLEHDPALAPPRRPGHRGRRAERPQLVGRELARCGRRAARSVRYPTRHAHGLRRHGQDEPRPRGGGRRAVRRPRARGGAGTRAAERSGPHSESRRPPATPLADDRRRARRTRPDPRPRRQPRAPATAFTDIAELLRAAPTLKILATSRVPLHIAPEREYRVPPLDLPARGERLDAIAPHRAVRLYVERARPGRPGLRADGGERPRVARITRGARRTPARDRARCRARSRPRRRRHAIGSARRCVPRPARAGPSRAPAFAARDDRVERPPARPGLRHGRWRLAAFPAGATLDALEAVAEPGTDVAEALDVLLDASLVTRRSQRASHDSGCSRRSGPTRRQRSTETSPATRPGGDSSHGASRSQTTASRATGRAEHPGSTASSRSSRTFAPPSTSRADRRRRRRSTAGELDAPLLARARSRHRGEAATGGGARARRGHRAWRSRDSSGRRRSCGW